MAFFSINPRLWVPSLALWRLTRLSSQLTLPNQQSASYICLELLPNNKTSHSRAVNTWCLPPRLALCFESRPWFLSTNSAKSVPRVENPWCVGQNFSAQLPLISAPALTVWLETVPFSILRLSFSNHIAADESGNKSALVGLQVTLQPLLGLISFSDKHNNKNELPASPDTIPELDNLCFLSE